MWYSVRQSSDNFVKSLKFHRRGVFDCKQLFFIENDIKSKLWKQFIVDFLEDLWSISTHAQFQGNILCSPKASIRIVSKVSDTDALCTSFIALYRRPLILIMHICPQWWKNINLYYIIHLALTVVKETEKVFYSSYFSKTTTKKKSNNSINWDTNLHVYDQIGSNFILSQS